MSKLCQLRDSRSRLQIGIISRANRAHRRRLISRVGLRGVLEVRVGPARAVHADVAREVDVRAAGT
jgi:hypothetical protein